MLSFLPGRTMFPFSKRQRLTLPPVPQEVKRELEEEVLCHQFWQLVAQEQERELEEKVKREPEEEVPCHQLVAQEVKREPEEEVPCHQLVSRERGRRELEEEVLLLQKDFDLAMLRIDEIRRSKCELAIQVKGKLLRIKDLEEDSANLEWGLTNCRKCHEYAIRENIELKLQMAAWKQSWRKLLKRRLQTQFTPDSNSSTPDSK